MWAGKAMFFNASLKDISETRRSGPHRVSKQTAGWTGKLEMRLGIYRHLKSCLAAFVLSNVFALSAHAAHSASCIAPEVTLLGTTTALSEGYRLTVESSETDIGGVVLNRRLDLSSSFSFDLEIYTGDTGADGAGLGLTFHNDTRGKSAISSSLGESMGFGLTDAISPSLNIELDTTDEGSADLSSNHWAVILDGDVRQSSSGNVVIGSTSFGYSIENNDYYDATLAWNASTNTLTFTFNGSQLFSTVVDIPSHVGTDYPWFVITAATDNSQDNEHSACFKSEPAYAPRNIVIDIDDSGYNTLRDAIDYANANSGIDDISFDIPWSGAQTITLSSGLPTITDAGVTIDGTTQSGASCGDLWNGTAHTLMVELDGPGSGYGITTSAADTTIKGLSITDFQIGIVGAGSDSNLTIQCNYLGLNPDGTSAGNTGAGTAVLGSSSLIGGSTAGQGNVISSNYFGVLSENGASAVTVTGNFIGTDPSGTSARANTWGINNYTGSVTYAEISNNLISGNSDDGIFFDSGDTVSGSSGDLVISGNYIGVNRAGTSALANGGDGIAFDSSNVTGVTIGGTSASDRNIISGNTGAGLSIINSSDIDIFGNYVGLNASGTGAVGNSGIGIYTSGANSLNIGNGASSGRNVIAGNGNRAIQPRGTFSNLTIDGNYIGTDSTGNTALTNGANVSANIKDAISIDSGASVSSLTITDNVIGGYSAALIEFWGASADTVVIQGNSLGVGADGSSNIASSSIEAALYLGGGTMNWSNFTIGGTGAGEGNIIANGGADGIEISTSGTGISIVGNSVYSNTGDGIELLSGTGISIRQNSIYSNTGLGIDLGTDGTTANDDGDADSGVNDLQNFPVLNTLEVSSTSLTYDLNLNAASNSNGYRIEFFISDAGSASGYGEGQTYVGYLDVAGTYGDQNYSGTLTMTQSVSGGAILTATVTAKTASGYGSTSEFAANVEATEAADPLVVTSTADTNTIGTLRYAMNYANANSASDSISFNISGTGPFTITIASDLPTITDADVSIDGTTQSGASCGDLWSGTSHTLMIELDGPGSGYGITTTASSTTIKGLSITDFQLGILASVGSASTVVQCNYIGLNPDGTAAGNTGVGVTAVGADLLIGGLTAGEGNVISSNPYGVLSYDGSSGTMVRGNFIGTDPTGSAARANTYGINNYSGTVTWSDITENLISGNSNEAISFEGDDTVTGSSGDFLIQGNYIGLNRAGTGSLSNGRGISFQGSGQTGITIGGTTSSDRNVIGGNSNQGIYITNASDIDIYGNYIGLTADGLTEITNWQHGIWLYDASSINVGNGAASGRNVIGSSANRAITLESTANSISINGNYVGTDVTGNTPLTNAPFTGLGQRDAIGMYGTMNSVSILSNVIGGFDEAAIESWGASGSGVTIQGNYLNVGADGSSDISTGTLSVDNSDYSAVLMLANGNSFTSLVIGGTGAGEGNIITNGPNVGAYIDNSNAVTFAGNTVHSNVSHGVRINGTSSTSVSLLQNSIYSNGGVGIDLGTDGQTANDSGDSDTGPNNLLNFPVLNGLYGDGTTSLRYEFTLDAPANTEGYRIEFFKTSVVNGTGYGDAETYIGAMDTGAHAGGSVDYSGTFTSDIAVSPDDIITVTATSKTGASSYGGTSEFALNNTMIAPYDYSDSPQTGTSYGTARHDI